MFFTFLTQHRLFRWPMLVIASALHLLLGILIVLDPSARFSTPLYPIAWLPASVAGLSLIFFSYLGFWALTRPVPSWKTLAALMPQQAVLVLSTSAVLYSTWIGRFLDGVPRSHAFLLGDHATTVLLAIMHTIALVMMHAPYVESKKVRSAEKEQHTGAEAE